MKNKNITRVQSSNGVTRNSPKLEKYRYGNYVANALLHLVGKVINLKK